MHIRKLVGAGDRIIGLVMPFIVIGVIANILWRSVFTMGFGSAGLIVGIVLLVVGVPIWLTSVVQVIAVVPKGRLITGGPFALVLHPLYTSVAILVLPGLGLVLDTWLGFALGAILYVASRLFSPAEERELASTFGEEYSTYRRRVILPWL